MRYYAAPMEGVTGFVFRQAHSRYFPGIDRYYMPFVSPGQGGGLTAREKRDILPANNAGIPVVPQILSRRAEDFLRTAALLAEYGYDEVNLNLGCPSGTVVAKGKGSGFLDRPSELDRFLDAIFASAPLPISVKTRLGITEADEFEEILPIFNRYPIKELTIHPRVQRDFYKKPLHPAQFEWALAHTVLPVCYNGDLVTKAECATCFAQFPQVQSVMIGRGLIANPTLVRQLQGGAAADRVTLRAYHDALLAGYTEVFGDARNAMLRMKEVWLYLIHLFEDGDRLHKRIRKARDTQSYAQAVDEIFTSLVLRDDTQRQPGVLDFV